MSLPLLAGLLLLSLLAILAASEAFTNALQCLGERMGLSEGVTGSVFAAVGTALPETLVPVLAVFAGGAVARVNEEIGVGAILGAPLMLSTLAIGLMGVAALPARGARGRLQPEPGGLRRDLDHFLAAFLLAGAALFLPVGRGPLRLAVAGALAGIYGLYLARTLRASSALVAAGHATEADEPLLAVRLGLPAHPLVMGAQLLLALGVLVAGTRGFIEGVGGLSAAWGFSPLLLSLVIVPVATELPEKINSVLWVRRGRDTLAFGNVTGAMVFQGTLLPALGILLTPWQPDRAVLPGVAVTLLGALWLRIAARGGAIAPRALLVNGLLYVGYLALQAGRAGG